MVDEELSSLQINEENFIGNEFNVFHMESGNAKSVFEGYKRDNNLKQELKQSMTTNTETKVANVANETVTSGSNVGSIATSSAAAGTTATTIATTVVVAAGGAGIGIVALGVSFAAFNAKINNFKYNLDNENIVLNYDFEIGYNVKGLLHVALTNNNGFEIIQDYEVLEEKNDEIVVEGYTYSSFISGQFKNQPDNQQIVYDTEYSLFIYSIINEEKRFYYQSNEPIVFKQEGPVEPIYESPSFIGEVITKKDPNRLVGSTNAVIYVEDKDDEDDTLSIKVTQKGLEEPMYEQYFSFNTEEGDEGNSGVPMQDGYKYEVGLKFSGLEIGSEYVIEYIFEGYRYGDGSASGGNGETYTIVMHSEEFVINEDEVTELMPYVGLNYYYVSYSYDDVEEDSLILSYTHNDNGVIYPEYLINILDDNNNVLISEHKESLPSQEMITINLESIQKGHAYTVEVIGVNDTINNTLIKHAIYY